MLYETYNTIRCNGAWASDSETIWDMQNFEQRPWGWTSGDAAGLAIFPGLVRYDEVAAGAINHAIRFTLQNTRSDNNGGYFVEPASHAAGTSSTNLNVMGMRIRLKASFDISGYSAANQVILTAMKKYGMILADNGGNFFFQGVVDSRWDDNDLINLDSIQSSNFEVVQMTPAWPGWDANTAPTGAAPTIDSFTASASTVAVGTAVTLTWTTTNDSYDFIDKLGGVRGGSVTFTPTAAGTITYTLNATNQYGRSTKAVTIVVQLAKTNRPNLAAGHEGASTLQYLANSSRRGIAARFAHSPVPDSFVCRAGIELCGHVGWSSGALSSSISQISRSDCSSRTWQHQPSRFPGVIRRCRSGALSCPRERCDTISSIRRRFQWEQQCASAGPESS